MKCESDKYDDCVSCAFREEHTFICEECDDTDQWEPAEPEDALVAAKPIKFHVNLELEKEAA